MSLFEGLKTTLNELQNSNKVSPIEESRQQLLSKRFNELETVPIDSLAKNSPHSAETETDKLSSVPEAHKGKTSLLALVTPNLQDFRNRFQREQYSVEKISSSQSDSPEQKEPGTIRKFFNAFTATVSEWTPTMPASLTSFVSNARESLSSFAAPFTDLLSSGKQWISSAIDYAKTSFAPIVQAFVSVKSEEKVAHSNFIGNRNSGVTYTGNYETAFGEVIDQKAESAARKNAEQEISGFYYTDTNSRIGLPKTNLHHQLSPQEIAAEVAKGTATNVPTSNPNENAELVKFAASAGPGLLDKFIGPHASIRETDGVDFAAEGKDSLLRGSNAKDKLKA